MELNARLHILLEEIREIAEENKRYLAVKNVRDVWQREQHELRRHRLELIKLELEKLKPKNSKR